jgi:hypothetical protein
VAPSAPPTVPACPVARRRRRRTTTEDDDEDDDEDDQEDEDEDEGIEPATPPNPFGVFQPLIEIAMPLLPKFGAFMFPLRLRHSIRAARL